MTAAAAQRPTARFLLAHPAHFIALGFGSGLSPWAPGTVGTLWAWVAWLVLARWFRKSRGDQRIFRGARRRPGKKPASDAAKPGPVAWADAQFKGFGARGAFGILFDDFVAAFCTLLVIALWRFL